MTTPVSFRPDADTAARLQSLAQGRTVSEVLRELIHQAYVADLNARAAAEAAQLAKDPQDQAEMRAVREEMDHIRAW